MGCPEPLCILTIGQDIRCSQSELKMSSPEIFAAEKDAEVGLSDALEFVDRYCKEISLPDQSGTTEDEMACVSIANDAKEKFREYADEKNSIKKKASRTKSAMMPSRRVGAQRHQMRLCTNRKSALGCRVFAEVYKRAIAQRMKTLRELANSEDKFGTDGVRHNRTVEKETCLTMALEEMGRNFALEISRRIMAERSANELEQRLQCPKNTTATAGASSQPGLSPSVANTAVKENEGRGVSDEAGNEQTASPFLDLLNLPQLNSSDPQLNFETSNDVAERSKTVNGPTQKQDNANDGCPVQFASPAGLAFEENENVQQTAELQATIDAFSASRNDCAEFGSELNPEAGHGFSTPNADDFINSFFD